MIPPAPVIQSGAPGKGPEPGRSNPGAEDLGVERFARVMAFQDRLLHAGSRAELGFLTVNGPFDLVRYKHAYLWLRRHGGLAAASGQEDLSLEAGKSRSLARICRGLVRADLAADAPEIRSGESLREACRVSWPQDLPPEALWIPLMPPRGALLGGILFLSAAPFTAQDRKKLGWLSATVAFTWHAMLHPPAPERLGARTSRVFIGIGVLAALIALGAVPVRESVLGRARIVPTEAIAVRAPVDGTIAEVVAEPNRPVDTDAILLRFDAVEAKSRLEVATRQLSEARTRYRLSAQKAVRDNAARADLPLLAEQAAVREAERDLAAWQLDNQVVRAPGAGAVLFRDDEDWRDKPVRRGDLLMEIAATDAVDIEISVAADDAIVFAPGADVTLFLDRAPDAPVRARLTDASYFASHDSDGRYGFRMRASLLDPETAPRLGLTGTARIAGSAVPLAYLVLRKPLAALRRQWGI